MIVTSTSIGSKDRAVVEWLNAASNAPVASTLMCRAVPRLDAPCGASRRVPAFESTPAYGHHRHGGAPPLKPCRAVAVKRGVNARQQPQIASLVRSGRIGRHEGQAR